MTAVVLLGHGSRDARADLVTREIARALAQRLPGVEVRIAYLDLTQPTLQEAVNAIPADAGRIVVVPLLLSHAFHARVDVPNAVQALNRDVVLAQPIGAGVDFALAATSKLPAGPLVLAAAGTSSPGAQRTLQEMALAIQAKTGRHITVGYAAQAEPEVAAAIAASGAAGVIAFVLLPGILPERIRQAATAAGIPVTPPLGADPAVIDAISDRIDAALAG